MCTREEGEADGGREDEEEENDDDEEDDEKEETEETLAARELVLELEQVWRAQQFSPLMQAACNCNASRTERAQQWLLCVGRV